jgi:hypothetical protein
MERQGAGEVDESALSDSDLNDLRSLAHALPFSLCRLDCRLDLGESPT